MRLMSLSTPSQKDSLSKIGPAFKISWLQHRTALTVILILTAAIMATLYFSDLGARSAFAAFVNSSCRTTHPSSSSKCVTLEGVLNSDLSSMTFLLAAMRAFPVAIAVFAGAPFISREIETGTYRFAWTQGIGRTRWILSKSFVIVAELAILSIGLGEMISWWCRPFNSAGLSSPWQPGQLDVSGLVMSAWVLFGFALGLFLGIAIRRSLPAMVATTAIMLGLVVSTFWKLDYWMLGIGAKKMHLVSQFVNAVTVGNLNTFASRSRGLPGPTGSWLVRSWITDDLGRPLNSRALHRLFLQMRNNQNSPLKQKGAVTQWMSEHHVQYWISYQPSSRIWLFQLLEGGLLVAATVILLIQVTRSAKRTSVMTSFRARQVDLKVRSTWLRRQSTNLKMLRTWILLRSSNFAREFSRCLCLGLFHLTPAMTSVRPIEFSDVHATTMTINIRT